MRYLLEIPGVEHKTPRIPPKILSCLRDLMPSFFWQRGTSAGFIASLLASFLSVAAWYFYGNPLIHPVFIGLIFGTIAYVGGSLATAGSSANVPITGKTKVG